MGPPQSARAMRKASLDMKSRSLEVPERHSDRGRLASNLHLFKQNSFCVKSSNDHGEDPFFDREMSFTEESNAHKTSQSMITLYLSQIKISRK